MQVSIVSQIIIRVKNYFIQVNEWKLIYLTCVYDHRSYAHTLSGCEIKAWKKMILNSGLNGIQTHDLCDTSAVLYQLSYQAN